MTAHAVTGDSVKRIDPDELTDKEVRTLLIKLAEQVFDLVPATYPEDMKRANRYVGWTKKADAEW